jgi:hypothetical protein
MSDLDILREIVDPDTFEALLREFGGQRVYFPLVDHAGRERRILASYQELRDSQVCLSESIRRIAKSERMTVRHIRRLIVQKGHLCIDMSARRGDY